MIVWTKFPQKGCFGLKTEKVNYWVLHIQISLGTKSPLKQTTFIFGPILPKKGLCNQNRKNKHHHWVLSIRISLGVKFQLKLTALIFWTKFALKGYFGSETEKVNITMEFCIFELILIPVFSLNWQLWFFGPSFPKKSIFGQNQKKWTSPFSLAYQN